MDVAVGGMLAYMVEVGNRRALSHDGAHEHAALERPTIATNFIRKLVLLLSMLAPTLKRFASSKRGREIFSVWVNTLGDCHHAPLLMSTDLMALPGVVVVYCSIGAS